MAASDKLNILQISTCDVLGGAEKVAWDLSRAYRERGQASWLAVGRKRLDDPNVWEIRRAPLRALAAHFGRTLNAGPAQHGERVRSGGQPGPWMRAMVGGAGSVIGWTLGHEDFHYPGSRRVLELPPARPDIVHAHNLHGGYFDLRYLPHLGLQAPLVITMHDAWLLSGHCAHSFACERWRDGCGSCPDLSIPPPIRRDATAYNWRRKRRIYTDSRLYVATPCRWLMKKVEQSMLADAVLEARVIPYGINLSVFHPGDRQRLRSALGVPPQAKVLLFAANDIRQNVWKDYQTMRAATFLVAERLPSQEVSFIALGENGPTEQIGLAQVKFIPHQSSPEDVAKYYQIADVYVHAARADTFPNTVLEALACGVPVVATAVGGIPEQIDDGRTGFLTPPGDSAALALQIEKLLADQDLRQQMGQQAAEAGRQRFDLNRHVDDYLGWYNEILAAHTEKRNC
jgi:glycosyltransferase involved in cell wall biosynthesis